MVPKCILSALFVVPDEVQEKLLKNLFHLDNMVSPFIS